MATVTEKATFCGFLQSNLQINSLKKNACCVASSMVGEMRLNDNKVIPCLNIKFA
jgi:hypothetical protein